MATSLNNMIDGSKLYPGYEFSVTVDTYSENVVLVTGFIGSKKYRGALLSLPSNAIKDCVSDNVFNSDFSSKNSYSVANMAITNYYSHKKLRCSDITMFSVNKRAKENYICASCKMKISYFTTKKESKSPSSNYSKTTTNNTTTTTTTTNNNSRSDITVLKQTLSYPDISDDILTPNITTGHDKPTSVFSCPEKHVKSLKRRKEHTNHVVVEKKSRISSVESQVCRNSSEKGEEIVKESVDSTEKKNTNENDHRVENEHPRDSLRETSEHDMKHVVNCSNMSENLDESEDQKPDPPNYEEYRSMPLSLSTLNYAHSNDSEKTNDEFLNRECPKPKKIWMKMIENEDIEKLTDPPLPSSEPVKSEIKPKPIVNNKPPRYINRSYKIKQTLHDKVILTVEKRCEKRKSEPVKQTVSDIYTFSEESEILADVAAAATAHITTNHDCAPKFIEEIKADDSIKSSNSSSSKTSKKSKTKSLNAVLKSSPENGGKSNRLNKLPVKIEPESIADVTLFKENNLVSTISTCESSSGVAFNLNDIVWAKITGYPFWPAKIISFSQEEDTFVGCIKWYAWNEISFIKVNNLFHFHTFYPSKYQKRNRNGKYQEAVKLAKFDCGMFDLPSSKATSDDNENASSMKGSDTDSESNAASYTSASL